jgi:lambda family phage portal protein
MNAKPVSWWRRALLRMAGVSSTGKRSYAMAMGGRLTAGWSAVQSSADQELNNAIHRMRGRARELARNAPYAKRAKVIVVNNVIGAGIGLQPNVRAPRGKPLEDVNDQISSEWDVWCRAENCHTGGRLHFADMERAAMTQVFEAGECILRKHYTKFGKSDVPFALELIEAERIADQWTIPGPLADGNVVRMGVEMDRFGRPAAYWLREVHPGDLQFPNTQSYGRVERVPADQIFHLAVIDRWPQARGEPWMHAAARRLNDMDGYSEAEIVAARGAASYMGWYKTPTSDPLTPDSQEGSERQLSMEPGTMEQLPPGWEVEMNNPNRPNPAFEQFMRMMLREVAAGVGVSYESLSRDYSQSNYSSSRLSLMDDRDLWRQLQRWWIRSFREPLHREWMQYAVMARAVSKVSVDQFALSPEMFTSCSFKPRGWSWIDPTKETAAALEAVRSGFTTVSAVISQTGDGRDLEDVLEERRRELDLMAELDILADSTVAELAPTAAKPPVSKEPAIGTPTGESTQPTASAQAQAEGDESDAPSRARVVPMRGHA